MLVACGSVLRREMVTDLFNDVAFVHSPRIVTVLPWPLVVQQAREMPAPTEWARVDTQFITPIMLTKVLGGDGITFTERNLPRLPTFTLFGADVASTRKPLVNELTSPGHTTSLLGSSLGS